MPVMSVSGPYDTEESTPVTAPGGWSIKLTACPASRYGSRPSTVMQEAWSRTWNGPSYPLRDSLEKKSGVPVLATRFCWLNRQQHLMLDSYNNSYLNRSHVSPCR